MLVGQRVRNRFSFRYCIQDLLAHLVHCVLDTGAVVLGKELEGNVSSRVPSLVKLGSALLHRLEVGKLGPLPAGVDIGGQNTVPGLGQSGVLVTDEAMEGRTRALEDGEAYNGAGDADAILAAHTDLDVASLAGILDEAVRVRLSINVHTYPSVSDDLDIGNVDMAVLLNEVVAQDGSVQLRRVDGMLLGNDESGVLDGVGCDYDAVISFGVGSINVALKQTADGHLGDGLNPSGLVACDLEDADIVLSITGGRDVRHLGLVSDGQEGFVSHGT